FAIDMHVKSISGAEYEVVFVGRQVVVGAGEFKSICIFEEMQCIVEFERLEDGLDLVESIVSSAGNGEEQVDFRV
ncbi:MAG: hypothetical protein K9N52_08760, partial [Verrucomicrobia bacterium]|nr:hypothetical protein [Verrucomicrobiota bacterium]